MNDPTVVTLERLNDPARYVRLDNVPIFCPHQRKLKSGQMITVDESDLQEIADHAHERQTGPGQLVRITLGHIIQDKGTPEAKQPRPVGLARITNVGKFGPGKETGLLSTMYIRREDWEEVKSYPFRSAEYYPDNQTITGVALLRRDPELDLGTITYEGGRLCLHYSMGASTMPDESFLDTDADSAAGSALDTDNAKQADDDPGYKSFQGYVSKHPVLNYVCQKYAADAAAMPAPVAGGEPSASSAYVPGMEEDKKVPQQMQRGREAVIYEKRLASAEAELAKLRRDNRLKDFRRDLEALEYSGVILDVNEEMSLVENHTPEQFAKYKAHIQKRYEKAPVDYSREPLAIQSSEIEGGKRTKQFTVIQKNQAIQYAHENQCSFDEALTVIQKKS